MTDMSSLKYYAKIIIIIKNQCCILWCSVSGNFQVAVGTMVVPDVGFLFSLFLSTYLGNHRFFMNPAKPS